jgi:two-component system osmolarity sensor histidine kinase EnvZ
MGWGILAACITLSIAWLLASRIGRRLTRMADAARQVGQGRIPAQLPETGPEELQCLASAFNRMSRDLDLHEKERAEILAGISHDLRTPLSRIRLEAELSLPEGAAREGMATDIMQMDAIIGQFLDYARGEGEGPPEEILPPVLLAEVAQRASSVGQPVELALDDIPPLRLKSRAITRALDNLISNAWKYGRPPVILRGVLKDGWLELSVSDEGPGIPATEIERLKRPFTRLESARGEVSGTGLGLAIAERVARSHGGRLELAAGENGKGLRAALILPAANPLARLYAATNSSLRGRSDVAIHDPRHTFASWLVMHLHPPRARSSQICRAAALPF